MSWRREPDVRDLIARARGRWYGLAPAFGGRRSVGGWGASDDDLTSLDLAHEFTDGFVSVETEVIDVEFHRESEWAALQDVLGNYTLYGSVVAREPDEPPVQALPDFPITLSIIREDIDVAVDGAPVRFVRVGDPTRWTA